MLYGFEYCTAGASGRPPPTEERRCVANENAFRPLPGDLRLQGLQAVPGRRFHLSQPGRHPGDTRLHLLHRQRRICGGRLRAHCRPAGTGQGPGQRENKGGKYIAYFQAFTNTYAPPEKLRSLYREAIAPEEILGLSIGTRPDCLGADVLEVLREINAVKPVSVELGLQTIHEETARYIRRGYPAEVYFDAVKRLKAAGIEVVTHIIIGLPGETGEMAVQTTKAAVAAGTDGVKFHLLHVLRGTDLAEEYAQAKFQCLSLEEYGKILKQCIAVLPEETVIHRITGDGAKKDLIAPLWSADKKRVLNYLHRLLE